MPIVYKNEVERKYGGGTSVVGADLCARRVSRCVEGEHGRRIGIRGSRV